MDIQSVISLFLDRLTDHMENACPLSAPEQADIHRLLLQLKAAAGSRQQQLPGCKPVTRYWEKALKSISLGPAADLGPLLGSLTPHLRWLSNPNYTPENTRQHFLDNYAYAELIGPDGLCLSDKVSMGLMLLGPETYYLPHVHHTIECLYVLTGRSTWHLADGPTISLPAGTAVFIPEGIPHAFWSMDASMVGVYLCCGEVGTYPVLAEKHVAPAVSGG